MSSDRLIIKILESSQSQCHGIPQYAGTCYYNAILNAFLLSSRLMDILLNKLYEFYNEIRDNNPELTQKWIENASLCLPPSVIEQIANEDLQQRRFDIARYSFYNIIKSNFCAYNSYNSEIINKSIQQTQSTTIELNPDYVQTEGGGTLSVLKAFLHTMYPDPDEYKSKVIIINNNIELIPSTNADIILFINIKDKYNISGKEKLKELIDSILYKIQDYNRKYSEEEQLIEILLFLNFIELLFKNSAVNLIIKKFIESRSFIYNNINTDIHGIVTEYFKSMILPKINNIHRIFIEKLFADTDTEWINTLLFKIIEVDYIDTIIYKFQDEYMNHVNDNSKNKIIKLRSSFITINNFNKINAYMNKIPEYTLEFASITLNYYSGSSSSSHAIIGVECDGNPVLIDSNYPSFPTIQSKNNSWKEGHIDLKNNKYITNSDVIKSAYYDVICYITNKSTIPKFTSTEICHII